MKKDILSLLSLLTAPAALVLLGLVLVISPDSGSALVTKILGWCVLAVGFFMAVFALSGHAGISAWVRAGGCILAGLWLTRNPLALAKWLGRLAGVLIALWGGRELVTSRLGGRGLAAAVLALGIVLIVLPMTTSRLVFRLLGAALAVIGVAMAASRLKNGGWGGNGPDIIDAL